MRSAGWKSEGVRTFVPGMNGVSVTIPKDAHIKLIIPGFGGGPYEDFAQMFAEEERTIVHVATFSHTAFAESFSQAGLFASNGQSVKHTYYWEVLEEILARYPDRKCDLVGYSEGAIHAIGLAYDGIGLRVGKLYLVNPAGLTEREHLASTLFRLLRNFFHEQHHLMWSKNATGQKRIRAYRESLRSYLAKRPFPAWFGEVTELGTIDLREHLLDLCEYGHKIHIVSTLSDAMIDAKRLCELEGLHPRITFSMINGTHQEIFLNPQSIVYELLK